MKKRFSIAPAAAGALALLAWLRLFLSPSERPNFSDFEVYWVAGNKAAEHLTVYDVEGHYQFKYSPFVALLWSLPTYFRSDYLWSRLHYIATGIGWYVLLYWIARKLDPKRAGELFIAASVVFSVALRDELKLGQVNLWPFLLVLPAWFAGRPPAARGFDWSGLWIGAAWGVAMQWKLYAALLGPLWLLRRRPAVFVGAIAITVLTLGAAMALAHGVPFAIDENVRWFRSLTASSQSLLVSQYNVSVLGVLGKVARAIGLPFGAWAYAIWLAALALGLYVLARAEHAAVHESREPHPYFWPASFVWALVAVVNPLVWPYWQLLAVPLFMIYFARETAHGYRNAGATFWAVTAAFTLMNWLQNYAVVHYGGGLVALVLLMVDAYRKAPANTSDDRPRELEAPLSVTSTPNA